MFEPIGEPRNLPFPLKNQASNGNTIAPIDLDVGDFVWPEDSAERTLLPLWISLDEWVAINSAVDVGADIAYPQQYVEVISMLMRQTRYRVPICSLIIDCIENDEDTANAIANALQGNTIFQNNLANTISGLTPGQTSEKLIVDECAPNVLMGKIKAIIDRMDRTNTDFLEIVEVGTNDEEKLAALFELVPLLNQEPVTDAIDFLQDILEDFAENYAAAITEERLLEIYCGLYCEAKDRDDCSITYANIFNYFRDKISADLTLESLLPEIIAFVLTGDFDNDDLVVSGMFMLQSGLVRIGGELAGMSLATIKLATIDALPSNLYLYCDCYVPEPGCSDLRVSRSGWEDTGQTKWYSGQGMGPTHAGGVEQFVTNYLAEVTNRSIVAVEFKFNMAFENVRVTFPITGNAVVSTDAENSIIMNETTHPSLFPFNSISGATQVRSNAAGTIVPNGALRMIEACFHT